MGALSLGNLLLGSAAAPAMSAIASAYAQSGSTSNIPWSGLDFSGTTITGISGSAIGGQVDPSQFVPVSAASSWSADIITLSGMVTALQSQLADKYRLSAGPGISMVNNTSLKITTISTI